MDLGEFASEAFGNIRQFAAEAVDGLSAEALVWQPVVGANTIAWLIWHAARVQDDHVAELATVDQVWTSGDWAARFGLEPGSMRTGYGDTDDEVSSIRPTSPSVLTEYLNAVTEQTATYLRTIDAVELDRIVDTNWDPPVTAGVRLSSVIADDLQHVGQAAYIRGLHELNR